MSRQLASVGVFFASLLLLSPPVFAQSGTRGYVQGIGGTTFANETSGVFGGGFGVTVHANVQVVGEAGYMRNILSDYVQNTADRAARNVEDFHLFFLNEQVSVVASARAPSFYASGGVKLLTPSARTRGFVDAAVGFANVSQEIRLEMDGRDITRDVVDEGLFSPPPDVSKLLVAFGGGLTVPLWESVALDVGYRYTRIFAEDAINVGLAYVAVGYVF